MQQERKFHKISLKKPYESKNDYINESFLLFLLLFYNILQMATKETSLRSCIEDLSSKTTDYKYPEQAINLAESLNSLSTDLYTDNIRFIYELIQNADDAQAKNVILTILDKKYLIIAHDGREILTSPEKKIL